MSLSDQKYTVTAALPYANGPVHIGHLAGVYIPADIYVRYLRAAQKDVLFVCGSDEHGVPITIRAKKEGATPQQIVDKYHTLISQSFKDFGIDFDIYSRTSSEEHHHTASDFFRKLHADGKFVEETSDQYFDEKNNQFLADRYIMGTCPKCGFADAYGDQCESCGTTLSPADLINPRSMLSGEKPILKATKHWYLPLNDYEPWLKEWILEGHKEWKSNVYGQCKSWIEQGLQSRAVTRDLEWGVPVPVPGAEGKVLYVWFDAPIGYISATKSWAKENNKEWEPYWKKENTQLIHFIGKDNIVFHCIIFPAMLKAHGDYILPENVPANEFLNLEGQKISTSRNWAVWLHEFLQDLPGKEDVLRYALCANAPETKDNDFTWKDFQARNNNELVAIFGNFINRALVLTQKYYEGEVPAPAAYTEVDEQLMKMVEDFPTKIGNSIARYRFREALSFFMDLARAGNKYLAENEPWKLQKTDPERVKTIMFVSLQLTANLAILAEPFLPNTAFKLRHMLDFYENKWPETTRFDLLSAGKKLNNPVLLFEKIEDSLIDAQVNKLLATKKANEDATRPVTAPKPETDFDTFQQLDMRTATIIAAEKVKKSKKLLKLTLDTGIDERIVLSGIAQHFDPEKIIGTQVTVLVNLAPRKMMGMESQGMVLMAEDKDGSLVFVKPDTSISNGSIIS